MKSTVNPQHTTDLTDYQIFRILDGIQKTATGLDGIPYLFQKIGAPFLVIVMVIMRKATYK